MSESPPRKKRKTRAIKLDWYKTFPWLSHNVENHVFTCKACVSAKNNNVFTKGKSDINPKKDDFRKHELSKDHCAAVRASRLRSDMTKATQNAYSSCKASIIATMKTVLCLAQEDIPNSKVDAIIKLQIENSKLLAELKDAVYFSLEAGEATDVSNKSVLVVYVRYLSPVTLKVESHFLGVRELDITTADGVFSVLTEMMEQKGLDPANMVGIATDGASVMRGVRTGVVTQLKNISPFLIANHCMAHRLQLAAEKAANRIHEVQKYIGTLNTFGRALKNSPKLTRILQASKDIHHEKANKIHQVFFTRWLSFANSTQALAGCIPSVVTALYTALGDKADQQGKALINGIVKEMASFKFISLTHVFADVIGILSLLGKAMQVETCTYSNIKQQIDACIVAVEALRHHDGPFTKQLQGAFPEQPHEMGISDWEPHEIKDTPSQRKKYGDVMDSFLENVVTGLLSTFPDGDIMGSFDVFTSCIVDSKRDELFGKLIDKYGKEIVIRAGLSIT